MSRFVSRRAIGLPAALILGVLVAFPLGVIASHQFNDVPDSNPYHGDIDAIADAGVTTGCGGGNYCPSAFVTREQMAAFMNRLGALGAGKIPVVNADKLDGLDSTAFLQSEQVNGQFVCDGRTFVPSFPSGAGTTANGSYSVGATDVTFYCNVLLPNGATVSQVDFEINDNSTIAHVTCHLDRRTPDFGTNSVALQTMASSATNDIADTDFQVLTDATIDAAVIDNALHHYVAWCMPTATGPTTTVLGVRVFYSVSGIPAT